MMAKANRDTKVFAIGGGIGSLAAAAFMIRDGGVPSANITIYETLPVLGGSLDAAGDPETGYSLRGGRMFTTDNYECTWGLFKSIPSLSPIRAFRYSTKPLLSTSRTNRTRWPGWWIAIAPR